MLLLESSSGEMPPLQIIFCYLNYQLFFTPENIEKIFPKEFASIKKLSKWKNHWKNAPDSQRNLWLFMQTMYVEQKNHSIS